jgi:hypothetical protein
MRTYYKSDKKRREESKKRKSDEKRAKRLNKNQKDTIQTNVEEMPNANTLDTNPKVQ